MSTRARNHVFEDPDSGLSYVPLIEIDIVGWLADLGLVAAAERAKLERRVRRNHPELFGDER